MDELLKGRNVAFVLNNIMNMQTVRDDWFFWYGSERLGIESYEDKLGKPRTLMVPNSPFFEMATFENMTIGDYARIAYQFDRRTFQKKVYQEVDGDKELYINEVKKYTPREDAKELLESFVSGFKESLES